MPRPPRFAFLEQKWSSLEQQPSAVRPALLPWLSACYNPAATLDIAGLAAALVAHDTPVT